MYNISSYLENVSGKEVYQKKRESHNKTKILNPEEIKDPINNILQI